MDVEGPSSYSLRSSNRGRLSWSISLVGGGFLVGVGGNRGSLCGDVIESPARGKGGGGRRLCRRLCVSLRGGRRVEGGRGRGSRRLRPCVGDSAPFVF